MFNSGWQRGETLGATAIPLHAMPLSMFADRVGEMFETAAHTKAQKISELHVRIKRDHEGRIICVPFTDGFMLDSAVVPLTWNQLIAALVAMTEFAFSQNGRVYEWNCLTENWPQEQFHWTFCHLRLSTVRCLPIELQEGMNLAGNGNIWSSTMGGLLSYDTYAWSCDAFWTKQYLVFVGRLWKTLEVAMNKAQLPLEFCLFVCGQIMAALEWLDGSSMSFVPVLQSVSSDSLNSASTAHVRQFQGKVRYRPQGLIGSKRYRGKLTWQQSNTLVLLRPFAAARGVLPGVSSGSRG